MFFNRTMNLALNFLVFLIILVHKWGFKWNCKWTMMLVRLYSWRCSVSVHCCAKSVCSTAFVHKFTSSWVVSVNSCGVCICVCLCTWHNSRSQAVHTRCLLQRFVHTSSMMMPPELPFWILLCSYPVPRCSASIQGPALVGGDSCELRELCWTLWLDPVSRVQLAEQVLCGECVSLFEKERVMGWMNEEGNSLGGLY